MTPTPDLTIARLGPGRFPSPLALSTCAGDGLGDYVSEKARVRLDVEFEAGNPPDVPRGFEKAGPRERLFFRPAETRAAIVTCGGLCPGLNNVIRSLVIELLLNYGVREVLGIRYGYQGLSASADAMPIPLTETEVADIHRQGGTILGSSRGSREPSEMADFLIARRIDILYCIGGDGTQRGAQALAQEIERRGLPIAIVGIPKTIDNDIAYVERTFGFSTALDEAARMLNSAHNEAKGAPNGVALVKLMGRDAGFIAAGATLASQEVNFTLVPEVAFPLDGPEGFLAALHARVLQRKHAVVAVAEGAGQHLLGDQRHQHDASGNRKHADVGVFLKDHITAYFAERKTPLNLKYIDPSYLIRSVPANSDDALFCDALARHAAHAGMAGATDLLVSQWNGVFVHVPIAAVTALKHCLQPEGELWTRVLLATGQPRWTACNGSSGSDSLGLHPIR